MPGNPPLQPSLPARATSLRRAGALIGLFLLGLSPPVQAQRAVAVRAFEEGNRRYEGGAYRAALEAYRQATETGYVSGALFLNMGNAYYRLDSLGQAIRYYEKARRLMPESEVLRHNLEITRARTADQMPQLPPPPWTRFWQQLVLLAGVRGLFYAGLLLYLTAAALIAHRIWTGRRSHWHRRALLLSLLLGLLLLSCAFAASFGETLEHQAVVIAETAAVRPAPGGGGEPDRRIHEGLLLQVLDAREPWVYVRLPDGTTGWVEAQTLAEI